MESDSVHVVLLKPRGCVELPKNFPEFPFKGKLWKHYTLKMQIYPFHIFK